MPRGAWRWAAVLLLVACTGDAPAGDAPAPATHQRAADPATPVTGQWQDGDEAITWSRTVAADGGVTIEEQIRFGSDGTASRQLRLRSDGTLEAVRETRQQIMQYGNRTPAPSRVDIAAVFDIGAPPRGTKRVDGELRPLRDYEFDRMRRVANRYVTTRGTPRPAPAPTPAP